MYSKRVRMRRPGVGATVNPSGYVINAIRMRMGEENVPDRPVKTQAQKREERIAHFVHRMKVKMRKEEIDAAKSDCPPESYRTCPVTSRRGKEKT